MSSFFYHTAQTLLNQYTDRFPLLKITQLLDWQAIEQTLANHKVNYVCNNGGRPAYPLLPMFRAILLGQWHSLSDPELERSLVTRLDFIIFCQFPDEMNLPDHSTLNRFRNWLIKEGLADELYQQINQQLAHNQLKVEKAPASKDKDARWTIKSKHWYLGYKLHARTDEEGFIEQIHVTPANASDVNNLETVLDKVEQGVKVYADKGYDSQSNREFL